MSVEKQKLAIIGGGIAGIYAAHKLQDKFEITIFEAAEYLGGHTNTVEITEGIDNGVAIDTGFIVLNDKTYPLFTAFLNELQVGIRHSDMSFSVFNQKNGLQYCSRNLNSLFAQRENLFSLKFIRMLLEIKRFWNIGSEELKQQRISNQSLKDFLDFNNFSKLFRQDFLYPLAAAVWSSSDKQLDNFPAITFLSFFRNHGWLSYADQPHWQTVVGGSASYVRKFMQTFSGDLRLNNEVKSIIKCSRADFEVSCADGYKAKFDKVICALHADRVLDIVQNPTQELQEVFASWKYSTNLTLLHTDQSFMPTLKNAWGSWNYRTDLAEDPILPVSVTYDMNRLQGLNTNLNYFVTLNPRQMPKEGTLIKAFQYTHPIYASDSVEAQRKLTEINGVSGIWFCGSYCGYGFHEDAVRSAHIVSEAIIKTVHVKS